MTAPSPPPSTTSPSARLACSDSTTSVPTTASPCSSTTTTTTGRSCGGSVPGAPPRSTGARANLQLDSAGTNEPRNYLIIGSDSRDNVDPNDPSAGAFLGPGEPAGKRSDTILLVRIDPVASTVKMLSFPRDLWVPIADNGQ